MGPVNTSPVICPYITMQKILSGKWTLLILCFLRQGALRFSELLSFLPELNQASLTKHLRKLESDGIVKRTIYPQVPPKVEYELTETGKGLIPALDELAKFGMIYISEHVDEASENVCSSLGTEQCRCFGMN